MPIFHWLPQYRKSQLRGDLFAGVTVGVMLVPQGMAYALIAGLPPVYGLYASIVPQLIYAIFGTSRQLSVAPVAMDSLMVAAGVSVLAAEGTASYISFTILLAFFMGAFQLLLGFARMGFITNLLSKPVISGFTAAAAVIIGLNQLKYLLGTDIGRSNKIYEVVLSAVHKMDEIHLVTLLLGIGGILTIGLSKRIHQSLPGSLIAVISGVVVVFVFRLDQSGVHIVQTIPQGLPDFQLPDFSLGRFVELIPLAMTISVVAFMEAYSVAKAIESKKKNYKVEPNQELVALGAANLLGSLFQSFPVTGGFSRSAVNEQAGAVTPLASVISALLIGLVLLFLTPLFYYLPHAILAAVIIVAVANLIDLKFIWKLWRESKIEFGLLGATFLVTVNFSIVPGIMTGVALSILMLLYKSAYPHIAILGRLKGRMEFRNVKRFKDLEVWNDKLILRIDAPISFINIQYVRDYLLEKLNANDRITSVIIDASAVSYMDATAVQGLEEILDKLEEQHIQLLLAEVVGPVRDVLFKTGLLQKVGIEHVFLTLNDALKEENEASYENRMQAVQHGLLSEANTQK